MTNYLERTAEPSVIDTYKMWSINLTISLISINKTRALECVSVINRKCMSRHKILDVNEGLGEAFIRIMC